MTKFLAIALKQNTPAFRYNLNRINLMTGKDNNDIYFTEAINKLSRDKIAALSLDPFDTRPIELYKSLQEKLKRDEGHLIKNLRYLAADKISAEASLTSGLILKLNQLTEEVQVSVVKPVILKKIIKSVCPNKTVKKLGYRTLESMLKRESMFNILTVMKYIENKSLNQKLAEQWARLTINDFVTSRVKFEVVPSSLTDVVPIHQDLRLISDFTTATIGLIDISSTAQPGYIVKLISEIIDCLECWYIQSDLIDNFKFNSDFGRIYKNILQNNSNDWLDLMNILEADVVENNLSHGLSMDLLAYKFDKFSLNKIRDVLENDSLLSFWNNTDYLMEICKNEIVSFNIKDLANDLLSLASFANRSTSYARTALKKELLKQYFKPERFIDYVGSLLQINKDSSLRPIFTNS